jgi:hypothetical protein
MDKDDLMRTVRGKEGEQGGQTLTLSNGKTYFLDAVGKRLRNVDDPSDSIDIEQLVHINEHPVYPKLDVRDDSIRMECKCGKWLFVNPLWKKAYRPDYPSRRP